MLNIVILAALVGAAYSQALPDQCTEGVQRCARTFEESKREVSDWISVRECVQQVQSDCEAKTNTLNWINGEITKAESGMKFSECDNSVNQCHLNFILSNMDWEAYMPCMNAIYPGCKSQSDGLFWVNEEMRKALGKEAPMCNMTVAGCQGSFDVTQREMSDWRAFNVCVTAIDPKCTAQSEMMWYINEEVRKATDVPSVDSCEGKVDMCVEDLYRTGQKEADWVYARDECMPRIYMECQKKTDTLWWMNDQISKLKQAEGGDKDCDCDCHVTKCINTFYMTTQELMNWNNYQSCLEVIMPGCVMRDNTLQQVIEAIDNAVNTDGGQMSGSQRVAQMPVLMLITAVLAWALA